MAILQSIYIVGCNFFNMRNWVQNVLTVHSFTILRISIGIVYLWFGVLKFFQGWSPAEELAKETIHILTFGLIPDMVAYTLLATWETLLGLLLISGFYLRYALKIMLIHMICTFTPLIFFPALSFKNIPFGFSLVGQYIVKNIVFIGSALVLYSQVVKTKNS